MPLYEYECFLCKERFERIQKVSAEQITQCPYCKGAVRRLLGVPALQFKGTGFYITDYGKGSGPGPREEKKETPAPTESTKTETKPASEKKGGESASEKKSGESA